MNAIQTVVWDFGTLSILILAGYFLRRNVKILQNLYIPASLVAGFLGILIGPQVLGKVAPVYLPIGSTIAQWPGVLTAVVFSVVFLGAPGKDFNEAALSTTVHAGIGHQMQVIVGLACAMLFAKFYPDLPLGFGLTPVYGFYGGHGTANAAGATFQELGWKDGLGVANTMATAGLVMGVVLGMVMINIGIRKGNAQLVKKPAEIPVEIKEGYVVPEKRKPIGTGVTYNDVLDPLCFQLCWAGLSCACGYLLRLGLIAIHPIMKNVPWFACTLIMGAVIWIVLQKLKMQHYIDRPSMNRISGTTMDYLVCSAIATLELKIFAVYFIPLVVTIIAITLTNYIVYPYFGRKLFKKDYFERTVGAFGQGCGVLATGLMLVRVVDPNFETTAAEAIAASSTLGYSFMLPYLMFGPILSYTWGGPKLMAFSIGLLIFFLILARGFFWRKTPVQAAGGAV